MNPDILIDTLKSLAQDNLGAEEALAEYRDQLVSTLDGCFCDDYGRPECSGCMEARRILLLL
jgi:hypothetical protein